MFNRLQYSPQPMAANSTYAIPAGVTSLGGFLCVTAGTITVVDNTGRTIISALPVAAGNFYSMPFFLGAGAAGLVTLALGASGCLGT